MLEIEALTGPSPFEDRSLKNNLAIWWPTLAYLATGSFLGVTEKNTKVSVAVYWDAGIRTAAQTTETRKHPGEWEAHVSEHEIGHTFLGPDHTPTNDNFPNVMQGGFWEYKKTVKLDKAAVDSLGGKDKVSDMFSALPNASKSTWDGTTGAMELDYEGYPGFDTDQRNIVSQIIRDRFTKFTGITPPPPRGLKRK